MLQFHGYHPCGTPARTGTGTFTGSRCANCGSQRCSFTISRAASARRGKRTASEFPSRNIALSQPDGTATMGISARSGCWAASNCRTLASSISTSARGIAMRRMHRPLSVACFALFFFLEQQRSLPCPSFDHAKGPAGESGDLRILDALAALEQHNGFGLVALDPGRIRRIETGAAFLAHLLDDAQVLFIQGVRHRQLAASRYPDDVEARLLIVFDSPQRKFADEFISRLFCRDVPQLHFRQAFHMSSGNKLIGLDALQHQFGSWHVSMLDPAESYVSGNGRRSRVSSLLQAHISKCVALFIVFRRRQCA